MRNSIATAMAIFCLGGNLPASLAQDNSFRVTDSIEMVHFNDPDGRAFNPPVWNISSDGSKALLVTTKGNVGSNLTQSTLWTLDLRAAAKYLKERGAGGISPSPRQLFSVAGQLTADQSDSYGSLITTVQPSADSRAIFMLVEQQEGRRELDKLDLATERLERLSPKDYNVISYSLDSRGVLYSAEQLQADIPAKGAKTSDTADAVRERSLNDLLWPSTRPRRYLFRSDGNGVRSLAPAPDPWRSNFSISPDGHTVIALVPVAETPNRWKPYQSATGDLPIYRSDLPARPVLEFEVVDIDTNSRRPLLGSPSGSGMGYVDNAPIIWSSGGDHALVTNTYLPLEHQAQGEQLARRRPCAAAYVDVRNGGATCIVFARSSDANESADSWAIYSLKFGRTDHEVVIDLRWRGRQKTECYVSKDDEWSESPTSACAAAIESLYEVHRAPVRLELVQSLDEAPTLWAEDVTNSERVKLWDPNPQLAGKVSGTTSVYRWLDQDKREWSGELLLPQGFRQGGRYPLVIQTHGFRPQEFLVDGAWATANAARPLAAAGFVVLQIEDSHDHFETREEVKIHVHGFAAAIDKLAASGIIDQRRVGIVGFSRTCWYVEESLIESPGRYAAAVIADGVDQSYLQYLLRRPGLPTWESERYNGGIPVGKGLENWIQSAPGFRLSEVKTPLRIQAISPHGLLGEWETYASLRIQEKPVDLVYFPFGQHVLQNPAERIASSQGDVDWFRFWLKGEEDPDPAKRTQYERWENLRQRRTR